jgi:hypothetical protein
MIILTTWQLTYPFPIKDKRLKKGEHHGWHSGDEGVYVWQNKMRFTMVMMHHNDEMRFEVNNANMEITRLAGVLCL